MVKKNRSLTTKTPVAGLIGFRLVQIGYGFAVCEMKTKRAHLNPVGRIHGGILCDLADAAMGYACLSELPKSRKAVTFDLHISFIKWVRPGQTLRAIAKTISHGRSLYFMECEIRNGDGELVAKASSTCKLLPRVKK